jgi:protease-4
MELINDELRRQEDARKAVGPKIAVLHARGPIIDFSLGASFASQVISRDDFVEVIEELRKNKAIKAVVMRVDSPGGSAYASDVIWKALRHLDEEKPLVVSMGRVAGSGGYYIACPARRIFAQPMTITGSIGVLGILPSAISMYNRMDYELAEMSRGRRATLGSPHKELAKADKQFIQELMDSIYGIFIERVATTRRIPAAEVRKIAEGRIYTGRDALAIGLVDELGGLSDAVESARALANIPPSAELKIIHYPRPSSLGELFESFSVASTVAAAGPASSPGRASAPLPGAIDSLGWMPSVFGSAGALPTAGLHPRPVLLDLPYAPNAERILTLFQQASSPAPTLSFDQQLQLLTRRLEPLCWMAMPLN